MDTTPRALIENPVTLDILALLQLIDRYPTDASAIFHTTRAINTKLNHLVPKKYLKQWGIKNILSLHTPQALIPASACSLTVLNRYLTDSLELFFTKAPVFESYVNTEILSPVGLLTQHIQKKQLACFIGRYNSKNEYQNFILPKNIHEKHKENLTAYRFKMFDLVTHVSLLHSRQEFYNMAFAKTQKEVALLCLRRMSKESIIKRLLPHLIHLLKDPTSEDIQVDQTQVFNAFDSMQRTSGWPREIELQIQNVVDLVEKLLTNLPDKSWLHNVTNSEFIRDFASSHLSEYVKADYLIIATTTPLWTSTTPIVIQPSIYYKEQYNRCSRQQKIKMATFTQKGINLKKVFDLKKEALDILTYSASPHVLIIKSSANVCDLLKHLYLNAPNKELFIRTLHNLPNPIIK